MGNSSEFLEPSLVCAVCETADRIRHGDHHDALVRSVTSGGQDAPIGGDAGHQDGVDPEARHYGSELCPDWGHTCP